MFWGVFFVFFTDAVSSIITVKTLQKVVLYWKLWCYIVHVKNFVLYSYRYCSSNTWKGFPVRLSSHSAGHCDEAFTGDETWHLPKVESVSNNIYKYHNARNKSVHKMLPHSLVYSEC